LRDCGTQLAQGYFCGRPLPASEFEDLLARHESARQGGLPVPQPDIAIQGVSRVHA
jgi:hypothetical protein